MYNLTYCELVIGCSNTRIPSSDKKIASSDGTVCFVMGASPNNMKTLLLCILYIYIYIYILLY